MANVQFSQMNYIILYIFVVNLIPRSFTYFLFWEHCFWYMLICLIYYIKGCPFISFILPHNIRINSTNAQIPLTAQVIPSVKKPRINKAT